MLEFQFWIILLLLSYLIVFQDLRNCEIDLWLLVTYSLVLGFRFFYVQHSWDEFMVNMTFVLFYFFFVYLIIQLYFRFKEGKYATLIDEKIGLADIWVVGITGFFLEPLAYIIMVLYGSLLAILFYLMFRKTNSKEIPFAGIYVGLYLIMNVKLKGTDTSVLESIIGYF